MPRPVPPDDLECIALAAKKGLEVRRVRKGRIEVWRGNTMIDCRGTWPAVLRFLETHTDDEPRPPRVNVK